MSSELFITFDGLDDLFAYINVIESILSMDCVITKIFLDDLF